MRNCGIVKEDLRVYELGDMKFCVNIKPTLRLYQFRRKVISKYTRVPLFLNIDTEIELNSPRTTKVKVKRGFSEAEKRKD